MKMKYLGLMFFYCFVFGPNLAIAWGVTVNSVYLPDAGNKKYNGTGDQGIAGNPIGPSWRVQGESTLAQCYLGGDKCISAIKLVIQPDKTDIYYSENGKKYAVFNSVVPGIGFSLLVRQKGQSDYQGILYGANRGISLFTAVGENDRLQRFDFEAKIVFVYNGQRMPQGQFRIPLTTLASVLVEYQDGKSREQYTWLGMYGMTVDSSAYGCTVSGAGSIPMNDISATRFPNVGSSVKGGSIALSLRCSQGVNLSAVMTDQSNVGNTGNILSLTPSSTARGMGIRFYTNKVSGPIVFGPDSSARGSLNQWYIDKASYPGQEFSVPLTAEYVRTGPLTAGSANGLASITFSYQ